MCDSIFWPKIAWNKLQRLNTKLQQLILRAMDSNKNCLQCATKVAPSKYTFSFFIALRIYICCPATDSLDRLKLWLKNFSFWILTNFVFKSLFYILHSSSLCLSFNKVLMKNEELYRKLTSFVNFSV
jgi:hypothetical protein